MPDLDTVGAEQVDRLMPRQELLGLPELPPGDTRAERIARRAGRPPGARNKRVEDAAQAAIAHFGDPLLRQVAIATMDTEELALRLGCDPLEAVIEQRLAAATVLPFLHSKRPLAVDVSTRRFVYLTIQDGSVTTEQIAEDATARVLQRLEYQEVSEGDDATV